MQSLEHRWSNELPVLWALLYPSVSKQWLGFTTYIQQWRDKINLTNIAISCSRSQFQDLWRPRPRKIPVEGSEGLKSWGAEHSKVKMCDFIIGLFLVRTSLGSLAALIINGLQFWGIFDPPIVPCAQRPINTWVRSMKKLFFFSSMFLSSFFASQTSSRFVSYLNSIPFLLFNVPL